MVILKNLISTKGLERIKLVKKWLNLQGRKNKLAKITVQKLKVTCKIVVMKVLQIQVLHVKYYICQNIIITIFGVTTRLIGLLIILRKLLMQAQIHWFPMSNYCNEKPRIKSSIKSSSKQNRNWHFIINHKNGTSIRW